MVRSLYKRETYFVKRALLPPMLRWPIGSSFFPTPVRRWQQQITGGRLLSLTTRGVAISQMVIDSMMKIYGQIGHSFSVEADAVSHAENMSHKNIVAGIEFDTSGKAVIDHGVVHRLISCEVHPRLNHL